MKVPTKPKNNRTTQIKNEINPNSKLPHRSQKTIEKKVIPLGKKIKNSKQIKEDNAKMEMKVGKGLERGWSVGFGCGWRWPPGKPWTERMSPERVVMSMEFTWRERERAAGN